ncbi:MAG: SGNH/GDSL hydrolase family protein [Verrucomicrobiae bacterium]|nr:SGNH/GDSL hydrolase family protein [Verrucomicrobiae bacterium]
MGRFVICIILALLGGTQNGVSASVHGGSGRVLFLGDSFSIGAFGRTLDTRMREDGLDVFTVVAGGASPYYWLSSYQSLPCAIGYWEKSPKDERRLGYIKAVPKIEDLLTEIRPDFVVVQTGVNLYATLRSKRRPKDENVEEVRSLIDQMCFSIAKRGAKSYWVLPPHSHEARYPLDLQMELANLMKDVVKEYNGAVFESQKYTHFTDPYPSTDGIHYGPDDATVWAERVASDFKVYLNINASYVSRIPIRAEPVTQLASTSTDAGAAHAAMASPKASNNLPLPKGMVRASKSEANLPTSATAAVPGYQHPVEENAAEPASVDPSALIKQAPVVDLTLRLLEKSTLQNLSDVPYSHALGVYEYEVVEDKLGNYPLKKIRVAHGIVFNRKFTSISRIEPGHEISLRLVPLSQYRSLQTWQTDDDLRPTFELPLYTSTLDD